MTEPTSEATLVVDPTEGKVPVRKGDVAVYAKKSCRTCIGTGIFFRLEGKGKGKAKDAPKHDVLCGCATTRFLKNNRVTVKGNEWFWDPKAAGHGG